VVEPVGEVRPSKPERGPAQIAFQPAGHTTCATTAAQSVGAGAAGGGGATNVGAGGAGGFAGGAGFTTGFTGGFATRFGAAGVARRRGTVVEGTLARVVDVAGRAAGSTTVDGGVGGTSAAPARDATNTSPAAKAATAVTTASCLCHHILWFSEPYCPA
jgi:hypothetical protein